MRKRLLCLLLALVLTLSLLPVQVLAYLGGIAEQRLASRALPVTTKLEGSNQGSQIWSMKVADKKGGTPNGEGIEFYLAINGPHAGKSVTNSARYHHQAYTIDSIALGVYEQARFTLQTGSTQKELKLEKMEVIDPKNEQAFDTYTVGVMPPESSLTVRCTFSGYAAGDPEITCYISYYIVKLGDGVTDGVLPENADDPAGSRTYAVVSQAWWGPGGVTGDNFPNFVFRYYEDYHGFSRMGHARAGANAAHVKLSRAYNKKTASGETILKAVSTDITAGLGRTKLAGRYGTGEISEFYSDSYGVDSPFVLAENEAVRRVNDVHPVLYAAYDAAADCLSTEGSTDKLGPAGHGSFYSTMHVWGFRDVYGKYEDVTGVKFTAPDTVTIPQDASKLGLYQSGGDVVVAALTDDTIAAKLKALYGEPLYTLRGNFEAKSDGKGKYYEFTDKKVALTPTITATWPADNHFYVRVDENGLLTSFDTTAMVQYSTPTFKLYWAKDANVPAPKLIVDGDGMLTLSDIDPEKNSVLVFIDIPQVTSRITAVQLKNDGSIILSGQMGLDLIFNCDNAIVDLKRLGYGPNKKSDDTIEFKQNGIEASGEINSGKLVGLDLFEINADINTFNGEESYDFSLAVNAFDLFETEANLELKRLNNGRLAPNKLYFFLAVQPGIPIAPPVPTAFLRGGGGGFDGLADTINGDYIAIPPIRLKLTAAGDYVKVLKGRAHITIGPSYLEYAGTKITIADFDVIDEFKMYLRLTGEERTYKGVKYTGVRAGGGLGLNVKLPNNNEIFGIDTEVEASMFGGLNSAKDKVYLQLDSRGNITARVKVPQRVGKLSFGKLAGKTLAAADVQFILGGQTAMDIARGTSVSEAAKSAWDNLSIYGGLAHTGNLWKTHWRVFYVLPNHVGGAFHLWKDINKGWSLDDEVSKNNWYISGSRASTQVTSIPLGVLRDDETGEQIGIAVMETSLFEIPTVEESTPPLYAKYENGRYTEEITTTETNSSADKLILMLFPKDGATVDQLRNNLTITPDGGTAMTLINSVYDSNGDFINWEDANCVEIEDEEGEEKRAGLLVATDMRADSIQKFTVEADCDFEYVLSASGLPTTLNDDLETVQYPREDKTYAIRYYYDTKSNLSGEHYYLGMDEEAPFSIIAPNKGGLAPTGNYYLTAVLVEKVVGDFNGDGKITEDEYAWITVDTKTSSTKYPYTNTLLPAAPTDVGLSFTGNETLTANWTPVDDADGYRVTLYYNDNGEWKQAGAPYELENADFAANSSQPAATINGSTYSLRMAPTVHGKELEIGDPENPSKPVTGAAYDIAPTGVNYRATVESFKRDKTVSGEKGVLDTRYYSTPTESGETELRAYTPKAITVTASNGQTVKLNKDNGYDTLTWSTLPAVNETLFTVTGDGTFTVTVAPDPGTVEFTVNPDGSVTADAGARVLIASSGRVKLTVTEGSDKTEYYLRLTLDDIAPIVTLDSSNVAADPTTGKYTIAGTTEPGLSVKLNTEPETNVTAGVDGRFEIKGTLTQTNASEMTETAGFESLLGEVTAEDGAGNISAPAAVVVTAREEWTPPENPSGPSGGGSGSGGKRANADKADKNKSPFRDVLDTDWFYEDVLFAHEEGLLTGTAKRTFSPYTNTTRAMMATVLWRMDGEPDAASGSRFTDVAGGQWYSGAVAWADENGIVKGYGTGAFGTNDPVTREQFAAMLYRYAQYSGRVIQTGNDLTDFKEAAKVSAWAKEALLWAVHNGIITGKPGKLLDPQGTATRAEIAAMLRRFVKNTVYTRDVK